MEMEQALLRVVLNQSNEGIHMVNCEGITKFYNSAAAAMDGLDPGDVVDRHVLEAFPSLSKNTSTLMTVIKTAKPIIDRQQTYTNKRGVEITTINTTLPVFGQQGLLGAVELAQDMTRTQQLAEQVTELRRRLFSGLPAGRDQGASFTFSDIIGACPAVKKVLALAVHVAQTDSPIVVEGETGTGKEVLVQAIHNGGPRSARPFIAQNCAALPESLLEGILFGSVRGSFTGAQDKPGLFELANGGTLFLDELNSMPVQLQAKLLRVLETGELRRLGDTKTRRVDVRIISAVTPESESQIRPDLYYRLNVVRLTLPPLRQRQGDIALLCNHFLTQINNKLGTRVKNLTADALAMLEQWHWPGNIRELANLIEGILNFRVSGEITGADLPDYIKHPEPDQGLRDQLQRVEAKLIRDAMNACNGNISYAAAKLKIPRQTLQRKLKNVSWHSNCID